MLPKGFDWEKELTYHAAKHVPKKCPGALKQLAAREKPASLMELARDFYVKSSIRILAERKDLGWERFSVKYAKNLARMEAQEEKESSKRVDDLATLLTGIS